MSDPAPSRPVVGQGWSRLGGRNASGSFRAALLVGTGTLLIAAAFIASRVGSWVARPKSPEQLPPLTFDPSLNLPTPATLPTIEPPSIAAPRSGIPVEVLVVLGIVLLLVLAGMAYGWLREQQRRQPHREPDRKAEALPVLPPGPTEDLPFDPRAAADYVIACWQHVEQVAAEVGRPREIQQTPTEFLSAITGGPPTPGSAAAELLTVYHHARFDHIALEPATAETARRSAAAVCRTLLSGQPPTHPPTPDTVDFDPENRTFSGSKSTVSKVASEGKT